MLRRNFAGGLRCRAIGGLRWALSLAVLLLALNAAVGVAAQDAWPTSLTSEQLADHSFTRGPGFYLALYKIFLLLLVFWMWVKSADWVSRDSLEMGDAIGMPAKIWNPIMVFSFLVAFVILGLGIPIFFAGFAVVLLAYAAPFIAYVVQRNGKVTEEKKVFTREHLKNWFSNLGKRRPREVEVKHAWMLGPPVELNPVGPLQMENQAALIEARQSPAYVPVKFLLADALTQRADKIMLDYTADAVGIRYQIDGIWHNAMPKVREMKKSEEGPSVDRPLGDMMLAVMKRVCHLNMQERRARQEGKMRVEFNGHKFDTVLLSQGTPTGERVVLSNTFVTKHVNKLEDLGMRDKLREQLKDIIGPGATGIVVFSSLPGDGLSSSWQASLRSTDRLMRDFITVEEVGKHEPDVENVDVQKFNASTGETPHGILPKLILRQPEVICMPELTPAHAEALGLICKWLSDEGKFSIVSLRGKEASDTLVRLMALGTPPEVLAPHMRAVIYVRLIRKLCEACREAVQPTPELLQRLGIPPGRVQVLYRERGQLSPEQQQELRKKGIPLVCPGCNGLGYHGRTALYEFLVLDDNLRAALAQGADLNQIKQLAKAAGNRTLQEEGILLMALGTTSLTELQRVLKQ
jgi:type II secretory ATPase GspE/PulE/Tfp pilus assembly ATPase PilB-like protein